MISVKSDIKKAEKQLAGYQKQAIPRAVVPSLNRTSKSVQSTGIRAIARETKLKQKDVRKAIAPYLRIANWKDWTAIIDARQGRAVNLIKLVAPSRRNSRSFRIRTKKGFKYKGVIANAWGVKREYKGTFIGRGKGHGKPLVFKRGDNGKLKPVYGPSVRKEFESKPIQRVMERKALERFPIEFNHNLTRQVARINRKYK